MGDVQKKKKKEEFVGLCLIRTHLSEISPVLDPAFSGGDSVDAVEVLPLLFVNRRNTVF
jgi:hypothetical protein